MHLLLALALLATPADGGAAIARANPQSFTAEATPETPKLGEPFAYTIKVTHPKAEVYSLPKDLALGDFDLLASSRDDVASGNQITSTFHLSLRGWALGKKNLPDVQLEVQTPEGVSRLAIPGVPIELTGALDPDGGAAEKLRDIAQPVNTRVRTYRVLAWAALALALLFLGLWLRRFLQREKPVKAVAVAPLEPPHVRAQRALEALLSEDLPGQLRQREFYFRLWEISRRYLGERFGFAAIDLTTEELLSALRVRATPGLDLVQYERFTREANLAKFAKLQPEPSACKNSLNQALALVASTTPTAPRLEGTAR